MIIKKHVEQVIMEVVNDVTKINNIGLNESLLDNSLGIHPADFLYIFDEIELRLCVPVYGIFENISFGNMTVEKIANALISSYDCN